MTNIVDYLGNVERIIVKKQTLSGYLELLVNAKLLYKCPRFDMKSKKSLRGEEKYYLADPEVERREYAPFDKVRDAWPRYLFTLDPLRNQRDGVRHLNLMEFLKEDGDLL